MHQTLEGYKLTMKRTNAYKYIVRARNDCKDPNNYYEIMDRVNGVKYGCVSRQHVTVILKYLEDEKDEIKH